ncbi:MAG: VOC family protein [Desulfobacterales bacterium]|nr:VOC family protein [Desulfobacterales bacterium]
MDKSELKSAVFNKLHHISIVVRDAEKTQKYYESIGIGPWMDYPPMKEYVKINVPDENGFYNLKIKCVQIGSVQLQLVEPGEGDSLYKDHLEEKGEGVFHIGFEVNDIRATDAKIEAMGLNVLSSGRRENGSGFSYLDTASEAGVVLLVRQSPPEGNS